MDGAGDVSIVAQRAARIRHSMTSRTGSCVVCVEVFASTNTWYEPAFKATVELNQIDEVPADGFCE